MSRPATADPAESHRAQSRGLPQRFAEHLASTGILSGAARVVVALSGGGDSTALLVLLGRWGDGAAVEVSAAHVAHGLRGARGEADAEASRLLAGRLGVPFTLLRVDVPASRRRGESVEAAARAARYEALLGHARSLGPGTLVATGHTRDDQAETVLLALERRAGRARGGIRASRGDGVVRPLLAFSRAGLRDLLLRERIEFREDETNEDERFARNRVRRRVVPLLEAASPGASERLARAGDASASRLAAADRDLDARLAGADLRPRGPFPRVFVDALPEALRARLLLRAAAPRSPGRVQLGNALERLAAGESFEEAFAGRRLVADARLVRLLPA